MTFVNSPQDPPPGQIASQLSLFKPRVSAQTKGTCDNLDFKSYFIFQNLCWESDTKQWHGAPICYLTKFSRKLNENEEILGGGGGRVPHAPFRSATTFRWSC